MPIMTSLSTRFLGHPSDIKPTLGIQGEWRLYANLPILARWPICRSGCGKDGKDQNEGGNRANWGLLVNVHGGPNLLEERPQPERVANCSAEARFRVEGGEFAHCGTA